MHFFFFTAEQSHFAICIATFSAKMLQLIQVIYFVIRCEANFFKVRLKIFKCTWVKSLLETNPAPSVKPSIILNLGCKPATMTAYAAPLLYIVLGLSAIILPLFCSVTSFVHSEVYSLAKYVPFSFFFLFTALLCFRFYMVDGKLSGTSSVVKAISKLSSWIIHVVPAVFVLQGCPTWISSAPSWAGLRAG